MKRLPAVGMDGVKEAPVRVTLGLLETTVKVRAFQNITCPIWSTYSHF